MCIWLNIMIYFRKRKIYLQIKIKHYEQQNRFTSDLY